MLTLQDVREWLEALDAYEGTAQYDASIARHLPEAWRIVFGRDLAPTDRDPFSLLCAAI